MAVVVSLLHSLRFLVRSRAALHLEIVALRHQLAVANRSRHSRLRLTTIDRPVGWPLRPVLWAWLSQRWSGWRAALHVVQPATVLAWHRRGFRLFITYYMQSRTHLCDSHRLADGRRAVSVSWDGTLRLWDLETGAELRASPSISLRTLSRGRHSEDKHCRRCPGRVHLVEVMEGSLSPSAQAALSTLLGNRMCGEDSRSEFLLPSSESELAD